MFRALNGHIQKVKPWLQVAFEVGQFCFTVCKNDCLKTDILIIFNRY